MKTVKTKKRVFAITALAFCFILTSYANEKEGSYFLLLKDNETISLNTYENNKIVEHRTFALPEISLFTTDGKKRVAILDIDRMLVLLYEIEISTEIEISVPFNNIEPTTILLNNYNLFVGGRWNEEMLVQYHIQNEEWYLLETPQEVLWQRKAIDDLVVNDSLLIAIDNIVIPKYVLFYHLNSTGKLELSHHRTLKHNSNGEHIRQGRITPKYLGTLSNAVTTLWRFTVNEEVIFNDHITIYNNLDLTSSFTVPIRTDCWQILIINDFLLVGDKVLFAHKENGLGMFEIKDSYFSDRSRRSVRVDAEITYRPFENEELIRFTKIPNTTKIVLTIKNVQGIIRHEIMSY